METRGDQVFLGRKPDGIRRDENGELVCHLPPADRAVYAGDVLRHELWIHQL